MVTQLIKSIVNRYLTEYIEDYNPNQLDMQLSSLKCELHKAYIKDSAINSMNLPIKLKQGYFDYLLLQFGFGQLWLPTSIKVSISGLNVLVQPNAGYEWDETDEKTNQRLQKQKLIEELENNFKRLLEEAANQRKEVQQDSFIQKVILECVHNIEITIENVHIRLEDQVINPSQFYIFGATFSSVKLVSKSQDEPTKYKPSKFISTIMKVANLSYLGSYFNCVSISQHDQLLSLYTDKQLINTKMQALVCRQNNPEIRELDYFLQPNRFSADVFFHRKPQEDNFTIPIFDAQMVLEKFALNFNKRQFEHLIYLLDNFNRISVASAYRKWRPKLEVKGNARTWWKFAITIILETDVRRRIRNWSWNHIREYTNLQKRYKPLYKKKLLMTEKPKPGDQLEEKLLEIEDVLDVAVIFKLRLAVREEIKDDLEKRKQEKAEEKQNKGGFLSGMVNWWRGESSESKSDDSTKLMDVVKQDLSDPVKKGKVYEAIGYSEQSISMEYPHGYVAYIANFGINNFIINVQDTDRNLRLLSFALDAFKMKADYLPRNRGLVVKSSIQSMRICGVNNPDLPMVEPISTSNDDRNMLDILFVMNPVDAPIPYDFGLSVHTRGLRFIYDGDTINELIKLSAVTQTASLDQLQTMASLKIEQFKQRSATSLEHMISEHKKLHLDLKIDASFLILPQNGHIDKGEHVLIVSLGNAEIASQLLDPKQQKELTEKKKSAETLEKLRSMAYEKYILKISKVQMALSCKASWSQDVQHFATNSADNSIISERHLLHPIVFDMILYRSIITDDPEIPLHKITSTFPQIQFTARNDQIISLKRLIFSILEQRDLVEVGSAAEASEKALEPAVAVVSKVDALLDDHSLLLMNEVKEAVSRRQQKPQIDASIIMTQLTGQFEIKAFLMELRSDKNESICKLKMENLTASAAITTKAISLDCEVSRFQFICLMDRYYLITDLQKELMNDLSPNLASASQATSAQADDQPEKKTVAVKKSSSVNESSLSTRISFFLAKADFALMTESGKSNHDSPVVFFNFALLVGAEQKDDQFVLTVQCKKTQMAITNAASFHTTSDVDFYILKPCEVNVNLVNKLDSQHIYFNIDQIMIYISPNMVQILLAMLSKFGAEPVPEKVSSIDETSTLVEASRILQFQDVNQSSSSWYRPENTEEYQLAKEVLEEISEPDSETSSLSSSPSHVAKASDTTVEQQVIAELPKIEIVVESGGVDTKPMLKLDFDLVGKFNNYKLLNLRTSCYMEYFNEEKFVWEPIIDQIRGNLWSFEVNVELRQIAKKKTQQMIINLESKEKLELTLTNYCLRVLYDLNNSFAHAVQQPDLLIKDSKKLVLRNYTGFSIHFIIDRNKFKLDQTIEVVKRGDHLDIICLPTNAECSLTQIMTDEHDVLSYTFNQYGVEVNRSLSLQSSEKSIHYIHNENYPGKYYKYIVDMTHRDIRNKYISFYSSIEVFNKLRIPLEIHTMDNNTVVRIGTVAAQSPFYLPLNIVYSPKSFIYTAPAGYIVPLNALTWTNNETHQRRRTYKHIECGPIDQAQKPIFMRSSFHTEKLRIETDSSIQFDNQDIFYRFEVYPPFILRNLLPYQLSYKLFKPNMHEVLLEPGKEDELLYYDADRSVLCLELKSYKGKHWKYYCNSVRFSKDEDILHICEFSSIEADASTEGEGEGEKLLLAMNCSSNSSEGGYRVVSIFAPFWMINNTGTYLKYSLENDHVIAHPAEYTDPVLVCFKSKQLNSKKKLQLALHKSRYSDSFSLDVVGTKGSVLIPSHGKTVNFCSIEISLSHFMFTKIVKFDSFYSIVNKLSCPIEVSEDNEVWYSVPAKDYYPIWPENTKAPILYFRLPGQQIISKPVSVAETGGTLLLVNKHMLYCHVDVTDHSITVQLTGYHAGCAPALIVNCTSTVTMEFGQKQTEKRTSLPPMKKTYFTWYKPTLERCLVWRTDKSPDVDILLDRDAFGETESDDGQIFWASFLDGQQRVFMITKDAYIASNLFGTNELTKPDIQLDIDLNGIGLSLVDSILYKELCYFSISSSDVVWEYCPAKRNRFKVLQLKHIELIEKAYQQFKLQSRLENHFELKSIPNKMMELSSDLHVNLGTMRIYSPVSGRLRRNASTGLNMQIRQSEHITSLHMKVNYMQLDNQRDDSVYDTIFCPVSPPRSIGIDLEPKPLIELSAFIHQQYNVRRFKYLSFLMQEFAIQIDLDFVNYMQTYLEVLGTTESFDHENLMQLSIEQAHMNERRTEERQDIQSGNSYYDVLHFSPIKMHLSFSLGTIESFQLPGILDYLVKSAGVTLIEFTDAVFKINYFERKNFIATDAQLLNQLIEHYKSQALSQCFVVVLGLDVIGNPVGLVLGLKQGVEDLFYEPLVGIIQGPEEFAEGLTRGIRSIVSSTVGGAAGVLGKITGQLGEGLSTFMDTDERKKRRERLNQPQTLINAPRNLARGFLSGITGLVTKPVQGARKEGFEGLVKGVGHGMVGLIAQPTTRIIDVTSGALNSLQRTVDINKEVKPVRLPRHLHLDGIVRSYDQGEAEGACFLRDLQKTGHLRHENYIAHCQLTAEHVFLVTDMHCALAERNYLFKTNSIVWQLEHKQIMSVTLSNELNLVIRIKKPRKVLGLFGEKTTFTVKIGKRDTLTYLLDKMAKVIDSDCFNNN